MLYVLWKGDVFVPVAACEGYWFSNRIELFSVIIISNLSNDRFKASCKTVPPHSAIYSFLLQFTVSSPVLKVVQ